MLAFLRLNLADRSSVAWAEARYHWPRTEVALQGQWQRGDASSEFGASASSQSWQLLLRHYF